MKILLVVTCALLLLSTGWVAALGLAPSSRSTRRRRRRRPRRAGTPARARLASRSSSARSYRWIGARGPAASLRGTFVERRPVTHAGTDLRYRYRRGAITQG